jgi:sulfoquinovose isomerase
VIAWPALPTHRHWLGRELTRLLEFGRELPVPGGGAAWLDDDGHPDPSQPVQTWITARTTHVYSLATMLGYPGAAAIADAALAGLTGPLRDDANGGWYSDAGEGAAEGTKACYDHAFVVLAASTATLAGRPGARELLDEALSVLLTRFWDDEVGMCVDAWDREFTTVDTYRGVNGNMHSVEAMLAAYDVTDDRAWLDRAARICTNVVTHASANEWRIPEHYDAEWVPQPELNADKPGDKFKPYGATIGHGLEWARLLLHVEAAGGEVPRGGVTAATALFDRAVEDGWAADGALGFVYTTDWSGKPVVRDRMHWVVAEATAAAAALYSRTGEQRFADDYQRWWDYAEAFVLDRERGSWRHQLDGDNVPSATVWPGKADLYHAVQSVLIPRLPLAPAIGRAVAEGLVA